VWLNGTLSHPVANFNTGTPAADANNLAVTWKTSNTGNTTNVIAELPTFTGDSGAGGSLGLVPPPAAGDAAAGKVLGAGGFWVNGSASVTINMPTDLFAGSGTGSSFTFTKQNQNPGYVWMNPANGGFLTPSVVQSKTCYSASGVTTSCAFNGAVVTGNTIYVTSSGYSGGACSGGSGLICFN
jgi:hypothetical protein